MTSQAEPQQFIASDASAMWWRHLLFPPEMPTKIDKLKYIETKLGAPQMEKPWALELSGRVSSSSDSLAEFAIAKANERNLAARAAGKPESARFRGFYAGEVRAIRQVPHCDVFDEPLVGIDDGHAELVVDAAALDDEGKIDFHFLERLGSSLNYYAADSEMVQVIEAMISR